MIIIIQCIVFIWCLSQSQAWTQSRPKTFPDDFSFGVATSSFQVEGGFEDGRGVSIWDDVVATDGTTGAEACASYRLHETDVRMLRELGVDHYRLSVAWTRVLPDGVSIWDDVVATDGTTGAEACASYRLHETDVRMLRELGVDHYRLSMAWTRVMPDGVSIWDDVVATDGTTGAEACASYHLHETDVRMLPELGVDHYRLSVAWTRVLPDGFANNQNELGLKYYDNLLDELLKYNIEPMVTLYHFDLPQKLQDLGGWANPAIVDWFEDYARVLFQRYGSKVKYWLTINQIDSICIVGYGKGAMAPFIKMPGVADYLCVKNVLLAHARVWRMYDKEFRKKYGGSIGIALALNWYESLNNATENLAAAELKRDFNFGIYTHPIFSEFGDFPKSVKETVAKKSKEQGFSRSRLPELSAQEIKYIKGTSDFIGINHYTTYLVEAGKSEDLPVPSFDDDVGGTQSFGKLWKRSKSVWQANASYGLYKLLLYINKNYNYPKIFITENGWSTDTFLYDEGRIDYLREYLYALRLAMEDGAKVLGYTVWSLMDNYEWESGFSERFGLYQVDISVANKTRQPRKSALYYREVIETRAVIDDYQSNSLRITISNRRIRNKDEL